jgi:hypothetical protein
MRICESRGFKSSFYPQDSLDPNTENLCFFCTNLTCTGLKQEVKMIEVKIIKAAFNHFDFNYFDLSCARQFNGLAFELVFWNNTLLQTGIWRFNEEIRWL